MGLEVATLSLIASGIGAAATVFGAMGSKPKAPKMPEIEKPAQAAKAPDAALVRQNNANAAKGPTGGPGTTLLTGAGGVDPTTLELGKSTLLGQ